jgi:glycosyltransferase involved in cell wall biosynthesis
VKARLAHVITGLQTGGAELMLERLISLRADSSFDPFVICLTEDSPAAARIRAAGSTVICLNLKPGIPNPMAIKRIRDVLRQERADLVQTWLYHADLLGGLAARSAGIPVLWGIHRSSLDPAVTSRSVIWTAKACRAIAGKVPARIVCCSEATVRAHVAFGYPADKLVEIPNGFDLQAFQPDPCLRQQTRAGLGLAPTAKVVGIIGRAVPLKNHPMFIEAGSIAARSNPDLQFVMVGEGLDPTNAALVDLIGSKGVADRFYLLGRRSDTAALLNAMDLFCLTSNTEAFPLVLGEAMACGVPCIATDVGDCRRIIGETGYLVQPNDAKALAKTIVELTSDPEQPVSLGREARQRIADHFAIELIARRYDDLWLGTLQKCSQ